jgi:hypothetical protein
MAERPIPSLGIVPVPMATLEKRSVSWAAVICLRTDTTPVHRTQHLYIADGVKAEPPRDPRLNEINKARHSCFGLICSNTVEVAIRASGLRSGIEP